jgi:hypothetical protein
MSRKAYLIKLCGLFNIYCPMDFDAWRFCGQEGGRCSGLQVIKKDVKIRTLRQLC